MIGRRHFEGIINTLGVASRSIDESEAVLAVTPVPGALPSAQRSAQPAGQTVLWGPAFVERIQNETRGLKDGSLVIVRALFERV